MRGKKYDCEVQCRDPQGGDDLKFKGVAHVVEEKYDDAFTAWFGAVLIECTDTKEFFGVVCTQDGFIKLEDGRGGGIVGMGGNSHRSYPEEEQLDEHYLMNFVGTTALAIPRAERAA